MRLQKFFNNKNFPIYGICNYNVCVNKLCIALFIDLEVHIYKSDAVFINTKLSLVERPEQSVEDTPLQEEEIPN